ncbi:hypothetical protein HN587_02365 [Candidatus Woesearchaeota archaeon]|jgi:tellurite resistance protein TehA-like permease|nr:hypothetical protein [Candidatus Woesearchaeota archaeon]
MATVKYVGSNRKRGSKAWIAFVFGVVLFAIGAFLVHDLILKFLKFAVGLLLIFISLPLLFGSVGFMKFKKHFR